MFWFNLLASGQSDDLTRHAGCPVLVGAKIGKKMSFWELQVQFWTRTGTNRAVNYQQ